jgi:hypothetical protein
MIINKVIYFFLFVTAVILVATARGPFQLQNLNKIRADGTQPPPPPIPWPSGTTTVFKADGTQPPPPPIPWGPAVTEGKFQEVLFADGTQPPPPPIPWPNGAVAIGA